jgi:Zn ribbon nucleic-acid-binding protein
MEPVIITSRHLAADFRHLRRQYVEHARVADKINDGKALEDNLVSYCECIDCTFLVRMQAKAYTMRLALEEQVQEEMEAEEKAREAQSVGDFFPLLQGLMRDLLLANASEDTPGEFGPADMRAYVIAPRQRKAGGMQYPNAGHYPHANNRFGS